MATILPFPELRGGDWTASERARLDELAATFAGEAGVEIAFGRTDAGDPWCVVLDARDEVLVHVAREGGSFVLHTADDLFVRSGDLRTAVERVLGARWHDERNDVVVPFAAAGRSVQVVTAVMVVASFVHHYRAEAEPAEDWSFAAARPLKPGTPREARDEAAAKAAAAIDAKPVAAVPAGDVARATPADADAPFPAGGDPLFVETPEALPEPAEADAPGVLLAIRLVEASAAISGSADADVLIGTDGDDVIDARTAPPRTHDLIDGGAGNDRLIVDDGTVAIGGPGADTFAVRAPALPDASTLLGVLVDFDPGVDRLVAIGTADAPPSLSVVGSVPVPDIFGDPGVNVAAPALPGHRLTVDLDGDGRPDGYLMVNGVLPDRAVVEALRDAFFDPPAGRGDDAAIAPPDAVMIAPAPIADAIHAVLPELI